MSLAVAVGILTALSALAGAALNAWFGLLKQSSEEKRWLAEFYLRSKLDAIRLVHSKMAIAHYSLNRDYARAQSSGLSNAEFYERIQPKEDAFLDALTGAGVYLTPEDKKLFGVVLGAIREITSAIFLRVQGGKVVAGEGQVEWKVYRSSYEAAEQRLSELLHPKLLADIARSLE